ncbi:oxidoreductase [Burkholderia cepacia]|uniref:Short chain dehydrogenase family protein n=1 Tax=Burkholderia cepacia TaxID=292 RepID=A0AA88Z0K6_BURCE|nr:oxidoreductase [Burkholderia cepacia]KGB98575.1 short chain dehydrogenase family protein [Burkholderia cepacia]
MSTSRGFTEAHVPDQSGKCFIVTGANTGVGYEVTRVLAQRGARVLLACRDEAKANEAVARIRRSTPRANLEFLPIDFADIDSIRAAAQRVDHEPRLDVLINNAGVMAPPLMRTTQGFELQFGVNHLGCFALTALLLPKLGETPGSRVVVTSSVAHKGAQFDWDDLNAHNSYERMKRYAASKLANALFFFELDRRLRGAGSPVTAVGCHPGIASTNLGRYMGWLQILNPVAAVLLNSADKGAWPALQAATSVVKPGAYYGPTGFRGIRGVSGEVSRSADARDPALARRLWDASVAMTGIDPGLSPVS